jgi:hypothetical protein
MATRQRRSQAKFQRPTAPASSMEWTTRLLHAAAFIPDDPGEPESSETPNCTQLDSRLQTLFTSPHGQQMSRENSDPFFQVILGNARKRPATMAASATCFTKERVHLQRCNAWPSNTRVSVYRCYPSRVLCRGRRGSPQPPPRISGIPSLPTSGVQRLFKVPNRPMLQRLLRMATRMMSHRVSLATAATTGAP